MRGIDMVYDDVEMFVRANFRLAAPHRFVKDKNKKYLRIGAGFDIETTRVDHFAFMYIWQVSYGNDVLLGRTWYAFDLFMKRLDHFLDCLNARIILWVANLGHEFAFIGRRFEWKKVFARESHQPLIAQTGRIEFRECLSISGIGGLANLARNYTTTQKAVGDLDYTVMRNSHTPIDEKEMGYIVNDVKILSEWGEYIFSEYSDKRKQIPMTATGIVRNMIKKAAYETGHMQDIKTAVKAMYPNVDTYNFIMKFLFRGGYTHANAWWVMVVWDNVIGADETSAYPSVMLKGYYPKCEFYPFTPTHDGVHITDDKLKTECVWFIARFYGIRKRTMHTLESEHKIMNYQKAIFDNGRLQRADMVRVALTEIDYKLYEMFYVWDKIEIEQAYHAVRGSLPEYVLKPLRAAYQTKARIKKDCKKRGINPDTVPEYRNAKATINSYYGCMVQRINFNEWIYNPVSGEWHQEPSKKSFRQMIANAILVPYWGIWVTAAARYAVCSTIAELDPDMCSANVLYCDTDSIYMVDTPRNRKIIARYNEKMAQMNKSLPDEFFDIGCFDWIGADEKGEPAHYKFKTLGAKRYLKLHDGVAEVTVAGMRKGTLEKNILRPFATDNSYPYFEKQKDGTKKKLGYIDIDELFDKFSDFFVCPAMNPKKILQTIHRRNTKRK